jgi:hypothetical protein
MTDTQQEANDVVETSQLNEEDARASIRDLLDKNNGPSEADINNMKEQYGEVFVQAMSETEVYIFRPLMREEFRVLQARLQDPQGGMDQLAYEEEVCRACTLWPGPAALGKSLATRGGTASSLAEAIAQNSNFFNPQQIGLLVAKL